jgi:hypothetical protein
MNIMISKGKLTCVRVIGCSAPLCPELNSADGIWYPDELICMRRCYASLKWVRKQKKIAKKATYRDFYFSKNDIEQIKRITTKTKGRNPDKDITQCSTQNHPEFSKKMPPNKGDMGATMPPTTNLPTCSSTHSKTPIRPPKK